MRPTVRYFLMVPLFFLIGLGATQAQGPGSGCTNGWSSNPNDNLPFLPGVQLPRALGVGEIPYKDIIISIESGCQERLEWNDLGFGDPGCEIIEYFNSRGEFLGAESRDYRNTSTVIFDGSDLDGVPGTPGYPSGVTPSSTCSSAGAGNGAGAMFPLQPDYGGSNVGGTAFPATCEYFPGDCTNTIPGAEQNTFIFFRSVNADPLTYSHTRGNLGTGSQFRAIRIISVVENTSPIIMGPYEQNLCSTTPIILDNGPSDIAGDPRYSDASNITDQSVTGLMPELLINITANNPSRFDTTGTGNIAVADARNGKIRALLCTESTDPYRGGPGSNQSLTMEGPGIGYLDPDANGDGIGDTPNTLDSANNLMFTSPNGIVFNDFYDNFADGIMGEGTIAYRYGIG